MPAARTIARGSLPEGRLVVTEPSAVERFVKAMDELGFELTEWQRRLVAGFASGFEKLGTESFRLNSWLRTLAEEFPQLLAEARRARVHRMHSMYRQRRGRR